MTGTNSSGYSGDLNTGQSSTSNQYSQIQVSSTPLSGTQWIGPAVRAQNNGESLYAGAVRDGTNSTPELMLYRAASTAPGPSLGSTDASGALARRHHAQADRGG